MTTVLNILIGGLILGGVYGLIAMGLSLQYGVARILNVSHGEFIMLAAMTTWMLVTKGVDPMLALVICGPIAFVLGFVLHITIYRWLNITSPSPGAFEGNAMLLSFGLMFILANVGQKIWGNQLQGYDYMKTTINIFGTETAANRIFVLFIALVICALFYIFLARSRMGKSIRAASQDPTAAGMMGVKIDKTMAISFGIGAVLAGAAGSLLSMYNQVSTTMGMRYTVIALIVVVLGGMGSIPGSIVGGLILGMVGSFFNTIEPSLSMVAYYFIILALLLVRPKGLMGR